MEQKQDKIICPFCGKKGKRTYHHLWPKHAYGDTGPLREICEKCHRELEKVIRNAEILPKWRYEHIYYQFLSDKIKEREANGY